MLNEKLKLLTASEKVNIICDFHSGEMNEELFPKLMFRYLLYYSVIKNKAMLQLQCPEGQGKLMLFTRICWTRKINTKLIVYWKFIPKRKLKKKLIIYIKIKERHVSVDGLGNLPHVEVCKFWWGQTKTAPNASKAPIFHFLINSWDIN